MNLKSLKGFTLIEMLVVVLIIGILAAIALPQYQRAVEKSNMSECLILANSAYRAVSRYYLITGQAPLDWASLDINFSGFSSSTPSIIKNTKTEMSLFTYGVFVRNKKRNVAIAYIYEYDNKPSKSARLCLDYSRSDFGKYLCESLGGAFWQDQDNIIQYKL